MSMRLADSFPLQKACATGRQRQDASGATARWSSIELGASSDISKDGKRERKFALYWACNLIERFFNKTKQFDDICDVGETNLS
jgi:transposase